MYTCVNMVRTFIYTIRALYNGTPLCIDIIIYLPLRDTSAFKYMIDFDTLSKFP